jgi:hypothetical protein
VFVSLTQKFPSENDCDRYLIHPRTVTIVAPVNEEEKKVSEADKHN